MGSGPVRVGNPPFHNLQLDIYGELMDSVYLYDKYGSPIGYDAWTNVVRLVDWVCANWRRPDEGIWEVRGGRREFLYSRVLCWVAIDRAIRLATKRSFPAPLTRWYDARDTIYHDVFTRFWDPTRGAFIQHVGATTLDAAALLMPLVRFVSPTDPRWISTLRAIERELVSDSLVYRYRLALDRAQRRDPRSEEHTSELQSPDQLVCRLLLEKKKIKPKQDTSPRQQQPTLQ